MPSSERQPPRLDAAPRGLREPRRRVGLPPAYPLRERFTAEAAALVAAGKIKALDKRPYRRRFTAVEAAAATSRLRQELASFTA